MCVSICWNCALTRTLFHLLLVIFYRQQNVDIKYEQHIHHECAWPILYVYCIYCMFNNRSMNTMLLLYVYCLYCMFNNRSMNTMLILYVYCIYCMFNNRSMNTMLLLYVYCIYCMFNNRSMNTITVIMMRSHIGTMDFIWHHELCLAPWTLFGTMDFIWHHGLYLAPWTLFGDHGLCLVTMDFIW